MVASRRAGSTGAGAAVRYRIGSTDALTHRFSVQMTVPVAAMATGPRSTLDLYLPVWIPGSYLVREFAKHLQGLRARQGRTALDVQQLDKHRWRVSGWEPDRPVVLDYEVFARDASVRAAWLDAERGFFNATSLCLCVEQLRDQPHTLQLDVPAGVTAP